MKGFEQKLVRFMEGSSKRFVIPVYQRNYDWKIEQCAQLYDDLIRTYRQDRKTHFFGSIVSVQNELGRQEEYLIIDGQQRLTTVSLLFLAMYHLIDEEKVKVENHRIRDYIYEDYLVDKHEPDETRMKLKPIKNDRNAFRSLFGAKDEYISSSNLTINYRYFYERIQRQELTVDELFDAVCRLQIINISLGSDDNPQLIFESLNSTGLDLSEGDKIRNYILMGLPIKKQENYYSKYWNKIEICTGYDVSSFIRDYLSVKERTTPPMRKIYFSFKDYVERQKYEDIEVLLTELLDYSKRYEKLIKANTNNSRLNASIERMNLLETTVTRPFLLEVLYLYEKGILSAEHEAIIFELVESYIFRRMICDLPTNSLNKIFLTLHKEILQYDGTTENYLEKFKYALQSKTERAAFPDDDIFVEAYSKRDIYKMRAKNKQYIFERLENAGTLEEKNVWKLMEEGIYTVEHIMPQTLSNEWKKMLGPNYEYVHKIWLHRLANLTLTAYNSSYSNNPFEDKRDRQDGFKNSGIRMNQKIAQCNKWTEEELEKRNDELMQKAVGIWKYCSTDYHPPVIQMDICTLDDECDMTGRQIERFSFRGVEQPASNWSDMYLKVLLALHMENKSVLAKLAVTDDDKVELSVHVRDKADEEGKYVKLEEGIYIWMNTSTSYKINILHRFFKLYQVDESELVFYLKTKDTVQANADEGRYSLRRKFWNYAIPEIKSQTAYFQNVNTSKMNWISGFIGHAGLAINCIGNMDSMRVEFYISTPVTENNKKIYDYIYGKMDSATAEQFVWERCDHLKVSKIFVEYKGIGIASEQQWKEAVLFLIKGIRQIEELVIPIVEQYYVK